MFSDLSMQPDSADMDKDTKAYMHYKSRVCPFVSSHVFLAPHRGYPAGQVCRSCAAGCASCGRNATHCLSCEEPLLLHKHQCVEECPPAHTERDRECQHCPSACQECNPLGQCTGTETQCKLEQIQLLELIQSHPKCAFNFLQLSLGSVIISSNFIFNHSGDMSP